MNPRPLTKGLLECLLFLVGIAWATMPVVSRAATPPGIKPAADIAKENTDDSANPYAVIVSRNIFRLVPPPPPPEPEKPKVELPVVKITGFVNMGDRTKVMFEALPNGHKKDELPSYYSLAEGEKSPNGRFQLVKIHPAQDAVDVINDGVAVTLTVKDDSLGQAAAAPPAEARPAGPPSFNPANGIPGRPSFQRPVPPGMGGIPGNGANGFPFQPRGRRNLPSQ